VDGERRIKHDPPLVMSLRDSPVVDPDFIRMTFKDYARTLDDERKYLLSQYRFRTSR
jgi:hypothetical protein